MLPTVLNITLYYIISIPYYIKYFSRRPKFIIYRRCPNLQGMETQLSCEEKVTFFVETALSLLRVHGLSSCTRAAHGNMGGAT